MSFRDYSDMPNNFFTKCVSAYNKERELYDVLQMESYNKYGVQMRYYTLNISDTDPLFGETNNLILERAFDYMAYYELPNEGRNVGLMGIIGTDNFPIYISKLHYDFVSQFDSSGTSGVYPTYEPKIGDLVYAKYNRQFYRINMVKLEDEIFLQGKHTYTLFLENFRDKGYTLGPELSGISNDPIQSIINVSDIFDQSERIELEKLQILYQPSPTECDPRDPFNDWR